MTLVLRQKKTGKKEFIWISQLYKLYVYKLYYTDLHSNIFDASPTFLVQFSNFLHFHLIFWHTLVGAPSFWVGAPLGNLDLLLNCTLWILLKQDGNKIFYLLTESNEEFHF